jgi:YVTN family beta-propeller protein
LGYIYVANANNPEPSVSVIDGSTNTVIATINDQMGPRELAFDSNNGYIYVADVGCCVSAIDGRTNKLVTSIPTGGSFVDGVTYDSLNNNIYAVNAGSGSVSVIDGSANKVTGTIPVGSNPLVDTFDPDNGNIYVRWQIIEDQTRHMAYNASAQVLHIINYTASKFVATHSSLAAAQAMPISASVGFMTGMFLGLKH